MSLLPATSTVTVVAPPLTLTVAAPGIQGPPGRDGLDGAGAHPPVVTNLVGASSVSIPHPFQYPPDVRVLEAGSRRVAVDVDYPDASTVFIQFPTAFTGSVTLS